MRKQYQFIRTVVLSAAAVLIAGSVPMYVYAQTPAAQSTTPTTTSPEKPTKPVKPQKQYTYNEATGYWDSNEWVYDAASGAYVKPAAPAPAPATTGTSQPSATNPQPAGSAGGALPTTQDPMAVAKGSSLKTTQSSNSSSDINTDADIKSTIGSDSKSGDALVHKNSAAGNATSGDAVAQTTVVNTVHSTIGGETAAVSEFVTDIYGNVTGDITLYPSDYGTSSERTLQSDTTLNAKTSGKIENDISLNAESGSAEVSKNTSAGNATSGSAHTVANLVNLINSIISANKSFIGTINIHGNLNGDILISPEFIPQLVASNMSTTGKSMANLDDSQSIINNISLAANSGEANVSKNTEAGNATTGQATTNLTLLNLSGRQVVASNSLLVFVNVLGKWVGVIVDAPIGATAAMLGSGVTSNTETNVANTVNADTDSSIVNNVDLASRSGDANVTSNTQAGNATSGDATASANIVNISTSALSLSDWFGILFINVFGEWVGSFGVNTKSGDIVSVVDAPKRGTSSAFSPPFRFGFIPRDDQASRSAAPISNGTNGGSWNGSAAMTSGVETTGSAAVNQEAQYGTASVAGASTVAAPQKDDPEAVIARESIQAMIAGTGIAAFGFVYEIIRRRNFRLAEYARTVYNQD